MRLTVRRDFEAAPRDAAHAAAIDDAIRSSLFFTFAHHGVRADLLHVALGCSESPSGVRHRCALTGAVEGLGVFRVWGEADAAHGAIERALHRLDIWLVRERLSPRAAATAKDGAALRAA